MRKQSNRGLYVGGGVVVVLIIILLLLGSGKLGNFLKSQVVGPDAVGACYLSHENSCELLTREKCEQKYISFVENYLNQDDFWRTFIFAPGKGCPKIPFGVVVDSVVGKCESPESPTPAKETNDACFNLLRRRISENKDSSGKRLCSSGSTPVQLEGPDESGSQRVHSPDQCKAVCSVVVGCSANQDLLNSPTPQSNSTTASPTFTHSPTVR